MDTSGDDTGSEISELRATIVALRSRLAAAQNDCQRRLVAASRAHDRRCRELEETIATLNRRLHRQTDRGPDSDAPDRR